MNITTRPVVGWIWLAAFAVASCGTPSAVERPPSDVDGGPRPSSPFAGTGTPLTVSVELQTKWGIATASPARSTVADVLTLPGVVGVNERRTVQVSSPVDGRVLSIAVTSGDDVRRSQALVTIHAPALAQARMTFLQAAATLDLARRDNERGQALLQQEAIDQRDYLRRKTDYDHALAQFGVAESTLHSFGLDQQHVESLLARSRDRRDTSPDDLADPYLTVVSPLAGRVIEHDVIAGQHVSPQSLLFVVSDLSTLWAALDARESDIPRLRAGQAVRVTTSVFGDKNWSGRVLHVGDVVDRASRTVKVRVEVRNHDRVLRPNMYIQGELSDPRAPVGVITVPEGAVQVINGTPVVFVREAPTRFVAVAVEPGRRLGSTRVIVAGLNGSEVVAVAGAFTLKAEYLKSTLGGE